MPTGFQSLQIIRNARGKRLLRRLASVTLMVLSLVSYSPVLRAQTKEGTSSRTARMDAVRSIPFARMKSSVASKVESVVDSPSFFRRMPTEQITCDPDLFTFMVRRPEVMVNIWQVMGITKVTARRINDYSFVGNDGSGTICRCDLVYATRNLHVYYGEGSYDGSLAPRKVTGSCVCVLRTDTKTGANGESIVRGTMDVFLDFNNFGADLLARGVAPFIGKTTDYNFVETAKFIGQISQVCQMSPGGAKNLANKLTSIQPETRAEFARIASTIGMRSRQNGLYTNRPSEKLGVSPKSSSLPSAQSPMAASVPPQTLSHRRMNDPSSLAAPNELPARMHLSDSKESGLQADTLVANQVTPTGPTLETRPEILPADVKSENLSDGSETRQASSVRPIKPQIFMRR